jgi:hypothetical protein
VDSITVMCGSCAITVAQIEPPSEWPDDGPDRLILGDRQFHLLGAMRLSGSLDGIQRWTKTIFTNHGISVHDQMAVCLGDRLALIAQPDVLCIAPMTGGVIWRYAGDGASLFGLYHTPDGSALILHGELEIVRLTRDGMVVWRSSGRDIFTGPFRVSESGIEATDFDGAIYTIALDTGASRIVGQGKPYPHA